MNRKTRRAMMIAGGIFLLLLMANMMSSGPEAPPPQAPGAPGAPGSNPPGAPGQPGSPVAPPPEDMVETVVAKVSIPKQTKIKTEMIDVVKLPSSLRHTDAASSVRDVLDHFSLVKIFEKEQILKVRLGESTSADVGLAYVISRGKRAVSIPITSDRAVGGYVNPGMIVDVLGTFKTPNGTITRRVLARKKILAINNTHIIEKTGTKPVKPPEPGAAGEPAKDQGFQQIDTIQSVTFEVDPAEGEKLLLASQNTPLTLEIVHPESGDTPLSPVGSEIFTKPIGQDQVSKDAVGQQPQQAGPPPVQMVEIIRGKTKEAQAVGITPPTSGAAMTPGLTGTVSGITPTSPLSRDPGPVIPAPGIYPTSNPTTPAPAKAPAPKH